MSILNISERQAIRLRKRIVMWLKEYLRDSGKEGFVVGFSGGIDSTVITMLGYEAANQLRKGFLALILPIEKDYYDRDSALRISDKFNIPVKEINLSNIFTQLKSILPATRHLVAYTNLKARLRTAVIYYYANMLNYLVLGTVNKGEFFIGYFPKNSSAGDILPIADLLKEEIRAIAQTYRIPKDLVMRKASGCIWAETAEEEWGFTEEELDAMIVSFEEKGEQMLLNDDSLITLEKRKNFLQKYKESSHKRKFYPIFKKQEKE